MNRVILRKGGRMLEVCAANRAKCVLHAGNMRMTAKPAVVFRGGAVLLAI